LRITTLIATAAASALLATPAWGKEQPAPQAKANGAYCSNQSRRHIEGEAGTPFSACVKALAKLDAGKTKSAKRACKALSKRHVEEEKGTPFSRCVKAAKRLARDEAIAPEADAPGDDSPGGDDDVTA
jgi:hypothetical protein